MSSSTDYIVPQSRPWVDAAERAALSRVIDSTWLSEGPESERFLEDLLELTGSPYGVLAPNGTLALALGLMALGVGTGDEVLVPDLTFIGSATAVSLTGATPVFVDVSPETQQIDISACEQALTPRTAAIMPVHLYGSAVDMSALSYWATAKRLLVIEDAAQAIGVKYDGRHAGTFGDVGCFSFFSDKTITTGEGGLVVCKDETVHRRLLLLRNQGRTRRGSFTHESIGFNFRMTDLQAAVGVQQLTRLTDIVKRKTAILTTYQNALRDLPISFYQPLPKSNLVPFRAVVISDRTEGLAAHLETVGVQTRRTFYPLHKQPAYSSRRVQMALTFPNSCRAYEQQLLLPIYPTMSVSETRLVVESIRDYFDAGAPQLR